MSTTMFGRSAVPSPMKWSILTALSTLTRATSCADTASMPTENIRPSATANALAIDGFQYGLGGGTAQGRERRGQRADDVRVEFGSSAFSQLAQPLSRRSRAPIGARAGARVVR